MYDSIYYIYRSYASINGPWEFFMQGLPIDSLKRARGFRSTIASKEFGRAFIVSRAHLERNNLLEKYNLD